MKINSLRPPHIVAAAVALVATAFGLGLLIDSGDGGPQCGDTPVPSSALPSPPGFDLVETVSLRPEGCGADYTRYAVFSEQRRSSGDTLARFGEEVERLAWRPTECVFAVDRCFRAPGTGGGKATAGYFMAVRVEPRRPFLSTPARKSGQVWLVLQRGVNPAG